MASKVQGSKNRRAAQIQETEVLNSVKDLNLESVSKSITETQVEIQKVLADLSGRVMERLQDLQNVEESIRLQRVELKRLQDIEVAATTLDDLHAQISEQRRTLDEETAAWKRNFEEQKSDQRKLWAREQEEYKYRNEQTVKKQEDTQAALFAVQDKQNRDKQEQLEKQWTERENELKKREQELVDLRAFKEQAPEMVKKEVNAQVAIATNSVKKEYETKMVLAAKDAETEKRLADQTIQSMTQNLSKLQSQIDDLRAALETAHRDVKDISAKALESASGRATTEALQRLMEKDNSGSKSAK